MIATWSHSTRTLRRCAAPSHATGISRRLSGARKLSKNPVAKSFRAALDSLRAPDRAWTASLRIACRRRGPGRNEQAFGNAPFDPRESRDLRNRKRGVGTMKRLAELLLGIVGLALAISSDGALAATECNGVISGTVVGGVVVNAGDFCILGGANVSGGVRINDGGILIACASTINGGIVANGALNFLIGAGVGA